VTNPQSNGRYRVAVRGMEPGELMTVLDELFEQEPKAKVVVFSQWVRMHELIARRLAARGRDHVLFHGGVPAEQRPALIDRFHEDPNCRVFLSTDAGGVGLNLQHAAAVIVNMDLPWNPAVLEQRIGRVHRMGQRRSVQVINFVAQGSIEGGPQQPEPPSRDPWTPLLNAGLALITELARRGGGNPDAAPTAWIERDAATGREYLKLPLPHPEALQRAAQVLGTLAAALRQREAGFPPRAPSTAPSR
jgi:hypothetical protein